MPQHVIVDGSNLATEGRTLPSLNQLNEAIAAYRSDHPEALITVVVDATFGHRIDSSESAEFERNIETNAFVAPPAGAVGRGDGFILSIAQKVNAVILSNDSYQEFHGEYAWLFDQGRLVGGKPVPHVGWVFVDRVPVRGAVSRRSVKEQKIVEKSPARPRRQRTTPSEVVSADGPMPIPKTPPPGGILRQPRQRVAVAKPATEQVEPQAPSKASNDLMPFLTFVEHHPVGSSVEAVVDHYSSHGAYVLTNGVLAYVPLRLMADPAPRSAREVMEVGQTVSLVVHSFTPGRRSIDLATPAMAPPPVEVTAAKPRKTRSKSSELVVDTAAMSLPKSSRRKPDTATAVPVLPSPVQADPVPKRPAKRAPAKAAPIKAASAGAAQTKTAQSKAAPVKAAPVKAAQSKAAPVKAAAARAATGKTVPDKVARASAATPATAAPAKTVPAKVAPAKVAPAKVAPTKVAPTKAAPAKVAPAKVAPAKTVRTKLLPS